MGLVLLENNLELSYMSKLKCENERCNKNADVRLTKEICQRVFTKITDFSMPKQSITLERYTCMRCAIELIDKDWKIIQWLKEKTPLEVLFYVYPETLFAYEHEHNLKLGDLLVERLLRWNELSHCPNCGSKVQPEVRRYVDGDPYSSTKWVRIYDVFHCKNCGWFVYNYLDRTARYDKDMAFCGCYNMDACEPKYDDDYKNWQKILETL